MDITALIPFQKGEEKIVKQNLKILKKHKIKIYVVGPSLIKNKGIKFILEKKRKSKSYWIKKILLKRKKGILILISGDVRIKENFLKRILEILRNKNVGMVCCKIVPEKPKTLIGKLAFFVWEVHNEASKFQPKGGEAIAFKAGVVKSFHQKVVADESYIEAEIIKSGLKVVYDQELIIRNRVVERISEFFLQRVRYHIGHLQVKKETGYKVVSLNYLILLKASLLVLKKNLKNLFYFALILFIEILARMYANIIFLFGKLPYKWKIAKTSRK